MIGKENYGLIASMMLGAGKQLAYMSRCASLLGNHSGLVSETEPTATPNPNPGFINSAKWRCGLSRVPIFSTCAQCSERVCFALQEFIALSFVPQNERTSPLSGIQLTVPIKLVTDAYSEGPNGYIAPFETQ